MKKLIYTILPVALIVAGFYFLIVIDTNTRRIGFSDNSPTVYFNANEKGEIDIVFFDFKKSFTINQQKAENISDFCFCCFSPLIRIFLWIISTLGLLS